MCKKLRRLPRMETRRVDSLKVNPLQQKYFAMTSVAELRELADHIDRHGLLDHVHVLADGTILAGHRRLMAIQLLKWTTVEVFVRYDLESDGPAASEEHFLVSNLLGRHLGVMESVRAYHRAKELAQELGRKKSIEIRTIIAKRLRRSTRQIDRLMLILRAPLVVQFAFDRGELRQNEATRVALAPVEQQAKIASLMKDGWNARKAVLNVLGPPEKIPKPLTARTCRRHWQDMLSRMRVLREAGAMGTDGLPWYCRESLEQLQELVQHAIVKLPLPTTADLETWKRSQQLEAEIISKVPELKKTFERLNVSNEALQNKPPYIDTATGRKYLKPFVTKTS